MAEPTKAEMRQTIAAQRADLATRLQRFDQQALALARAERERDDVRSQLASTRDVYDRDRAEWETRIDQQQRLIETLRGDKLNRELDRMRERLADRESRVTYLEEWSRRVVAELDREKIRSESLSKALRTQLEESERRRIAVTKIGHALATMLLNDSERFRQGEAPKRQISTDEELDALKPGGVVRRNGVAYIRLVGASRWTSGRGIVNTSEDLVDSYGRFVIEVLHEA